MFKRYWIAAIALGIASWPSQMLADPPHSILTESHIKKNSSEQQPGDELAAVPERVSTSVSPTDPAEDKHDEGAPANADSHADSHLLLGDGYAQWLMALTGFAALVVSGWAVWLVNLSLREARIATKAAVDAVSVTREIGQAQVRAYVVASGVRVSFNMGRFDAYVEIVNTGQSPALEVETSHWVAIDMPPFDEAWMDDPQNLYSKSTIGAGGCISASKSGPNTATPSLLKSVSDGQMAVWVYGVITYMDVFGDKHVTKYRHDVIVSADGSITTRLSNNGNSAT